MTIDDLKDHAELWLADAEAGIPIVGVCAFDDPRFEAAPEERKNSVKANLSEMTPQQVKPYLQPILDVLTRYTEHFYMCEPPADQFYFEGPPGVQIRTAEHGQLRLTLRYGWVANDHILTAKCWIRRVGRTDPSGVG